MMTDIHTDTNRETKITTEPEPPHTGEEDEPKKAAEQFGDEEERRRRRRHRHMHTEKR